MKLPGPAAVLVANGALIAASSCGIVGELFGEAMAPSVQSASVEPHRQAQSREINEEAPAVASPSVHPQHSEEHAAPARGGRSSHLESDHQSLVIPVPAAMAVPYRSRTDPPERLVIPRIGLDARVIPIGVKLSRGGTLVWETAPFAVGHHQGTANPGGPGNVALSGHISSPNEGGVFRHLPQVKIGDGVIITTSQQPFLYRVTEVLTTDPAAIQVLDPTEKPTATLITCVPDGVYSHRLVVRAEGI